MKHNRLIQVFSMVAIASVLFGCAPYINTYYLPESQEGNRSSHSALTSDAPIWILKKGGATFYFSATKEKDGNILLSLNIQPLHSEGEISLSAKVREEAKTAVKPIIVSLSNFKGGVSVVANGIMNKSELISAVKGTYGTNNRHSINSVNSDLHLIVDQYLSLSAACTITEADSYIVQWPIIEINHKEVTLPPIKFKWKRGIQIQFLNG